MLISDQLLYKKAIAYYRHSAEDKQENSVAIQRQHTHNFARKNNIEIIHEEADEGKTGLLATRPGFENLFNDWVLNREAPHFEYILVYDVSRWGRFQDQDEAAYYGYRCKQYGRKVIYVAHGFPKEEEPLVSHLQISIERYMAAEYSRQLSEKVFYGSVKISEQGYSAGGIACFGMTRVLLDTNKKPVRILQRGEVKSISNERVTFAPSNDQTTKCVEMIFNLLLKENQRPQQIAETLNEKGIPSANGGRWNSQKVLRVLSNETYVGTRIYNKTWGRLKQKKRRNPRSEWVIRQDAFPSVIAGEAFQRAQEKLHWLIWSRWQRGQRIINKAQRVIRAEVKDFLIEAGFDTDMVTKAEKALLIACGVSFTKESISQWCFSIQEEMKRRDFILCIGIDTEQPKTIKKLFLVPMEDASSDNFIILSGQDQKYEIPQEHTRERLVSLCREIVSKK